MAQSAGSSTIDYKNDNGVVCNCKLSAKIVKAWTNDNPGRRFYSCINWKSANVVSCNFFRWYDVEKPSTWQHLALLEARDVMRDQREEISKLKETVRALTGESESMMEIPAVVEDELKQTREQCEALKREVLILTERSRIFRNVLISSSVGFTVALGVMMAMWKY